VKTEECEREKPYMNSIGTGEATFSEHYRMFSYVVSDSSLVIPNNSNRMKTGISNVCTAKRFP